MKLLVISDTHGRLEPISTVLDRTVDFDMLIHLGDHEMDAEMLEQYYGIETVAVPGNMDRGSASDGEIVLPTEWGKILLTHGHLRDVKWSEDRLLYAAEEKGCRAVFFGHTHRSLYVEREGITLLNPGSAALPRDGNPPSYAIVRTSEARLECGICFIRGQEGQQQKTKKTGHLSRLLNDSDRL